MLAQNRASFTGPQFAQRNGEIGGSLRKVGSARKFLDFGILRYFLFLFLAARFFSAALIASQQIRPQQAAPQQMPSEQMPSEQMNDDEREFFESANRERAAQSLAPLHWDEKLAKAARLHARRMAFYNVVEHQLSGEADLEGRLTEAGARFGVIAENIAVGANPQAIHDGWMGSSGHRKNILNPSVTSIGIGAVRNSAGLFAVEDFTLAVDALSVEEQEKKVEALLTEGGWRVGGSKEEARKACETDQIGARFGAMAMVRFDTPDLSKLPEEVEKKMRSRAARNATVGACGAGGGSGFAHFRIAVLLF